jgi:Sec-independent protein secretion pathway component TatC
VYYLKKVNSAAFIKLTIASIIVFSILAIALIYSGLFNVSSSVSLFSNIVLIIYSIYIVIDEYYYSETEKLTNNGTFLIASAVLFYAGVQFYFSLFDSMIREDSMQIFYYLWPIFQIGTIIYYNAFTYGLWKLAKS